MNTERYTCPSLCPTSHVYFCTGSKIPVLSVEHGASFLTNFHRLCLSAMFFVSRLRKVGQCMQNVGVYRSNENIQIAQCIL